MKKILAILILIVAVLLTACQPTPDSSAVVGKNDGVLEQALKNENTSDEIYQVPEHVELNVETNNPNISIEINAPVVFPTVNKIPVSEIDFAYFTQDDLEKYIRNFFGNAKLYEPSGEMTQSQIIEEIARTKQSLEGLDGEALERANSWIQMLQEQLKTAPKGIEPTYIEANLPVEENGYAAFSAYADLGGIEPAKIEMLNDPEINASLCVLQTKPELFLQPSEESTQVTEETKTLVQDTLEQLDITGMTIDSVTIGYTENRSQKGYVVKLVQNVEGIPLADAIVFSPTAQEDELSMLGSAQEIVMQIVDGEVVHFELVNKRNVAETINQNVALKPFSEIEKIIEQQLKNILSWNGYNEDSKYSYQVYEIRFEYSSVMQKNNFGEYMIVPTWNCYGTLTETTETNEQTTVMNKADKYSLLCINAIDGSVLQ